MRGGSLRLDEHTEHIIDVLAKMGPHSNGVAVCQPSEWLEKNLWRVSDALQQFEALDPELAELVDRVETRYIDGYGETEIAALRGIDERTVRRHRHKDRAVLFVAPGRG